MLHHAQLTPRRASHARHVSSFRVRRNGRWRARSTPRTVRAVVVGQEVSPRAIEGQGEASPREAKQESAAVAAPARACARVAGGQGAQALVAVRGLLLPLRHAPEIGGV